MVLVVMHRLYVLMNHLLTHILLQVITHLTDGYRLPPPAHCPRPVYSLMIDCWHPDHHSRPGFAAILDRLSVGDTSLLMNPACEPLLGNFGDDLEVGCAAYKDLQTLYCQM